MYNRPVSAVGVVPNVIKSWEITSHWVPEGTVLLTRSDPSNVIGSERAPLQKNSP
jgi:hypothetical protein